MQRAHWTSPELDQYWGLGFAVGKNDDDVFAAHGGSCPGYRTDFYTIPAKKQAAIVMANASGTDVGKIGQRLLEIFRPVMKDAEAIEEKKKADVVENDYSAYTGRYNATPWWGEELFFVWGNELASIGLPSENPIKEMDTYRKVGDHTFRRVRKDDSLAETIRFEIGPDGKATRYWQHSNAYPRMR